MMKLDFVLQQQQISIWLKRNKYWLSYLAVVAILSFAFPLFNFSLTIDEEIAGLISNPNIAWIAQGRWGMYLLNYLVLPNSVMPFMPLFITVICSALSYSIITRVLSSTRTFADYVAAPLFIACPTLFYLYCFNTINYGIGIAFFIGAIALFCLIRGGKLSSLIFILLVSFTIGVYQAFIIWLIALFFLYLLSIIIRNNNIPTKKFIYLNFRFGVLLLLSLVAYIAIEYLFCILFKTQVGSYLQTNFFNMTFSLKYWSHTFYLVWQQLGYYYLGNPSVYLYRLISLASIFIFSTLVLIMLIFRSNQKAIVKCFGYIVFLLLVFLPFMFMLVNGGYMPTRTLISLPLVISGIVFLSCFCRSKIIQLLLIILVIVCSFRFAVINNKFALSDYLSWKSDSALTTRLLSRLDSLRYTLPPRLQSSSKALPIEIVGFLNRPTSPIMVQREIIGESFYSHDEGNVFRVVDLMKTMGVYEYKAATVDERKSIMRKTLKMPIWPAYGSVAFINGIAVVKFGNYSEPQLAALRKRHRQGK